MAVLDSKKRRRAPRVPLLVRVECKTPQTYVIARCENISETGMLVKAKQTFEASQLVTVRFEIPPVAKGRIVQAGGIVVRTQHGECMAIQFTGLRQPFREAIGRYVEQTFPNPDRPIERDVW